MTRFTTRGWITLPFVILFRVPFALLAGAFSFIAELCNALANRCDQVMRKMPSVEWNQEWVKAEEARLRKEAIARFTSGSQKA